MTQEIKAWTNKLDELVEGIIFRCGYDVEFLKLDRCVKLQCLSAAINDVRFDVYELICEGDLYIERIIANLAQGEFNELGAATIMFDRLILAVSDKMQEILDDKSAHMRVEVSANDVKQYENEVVKAIFGGAQC